MKQAESASRAAETFMKAGGDASDPKDVKELKEALAKAEKEAEAAKKDRDSMKAQSESLTNEYDRLLAEKDKAARPDGQRPSPLGHRDGTSRSCCPLSVTLAGLEPAILDSEDQRLIH